MTLTPWSLDSKDSISVIKLHVNKRDFLTDKAYLIIHDKKLILVCMGVLLFRGFRRFPYPLKRQEKMYLKCRLLQIIVLQYRRIKYRSKQRRPRTELIWVHTVCHRGFLNIFPDEKSRRLLLALAL